ncbi:nitroreductase family protein [Kineococcus sp. NPDC059986]|uniref:nitroreductase family protein n=1 Tax=Kineococcus sp. NPDC059986 TaxID=3155538 RepID=UPI00344FE6EA
MSRTSDYVRAVLTREDRPLPPLDHHPDFSDAPREAKFFGPTVDVDLPRRAPRGSSEPLDRLGEWLFLAAARTGRRLQADANADTERTREYARARWSRVAASGGSLYPVVHYWVSTGADGLLPGVHHYSALHHRLQRLSAGPAAEVVRAAAGLPADLAPDGWLLTTVKFWRNAHKYGSFTYHVVTMDHGAQLAAFDDAAVGRVGVLGRTWTLDEAVVAGLLGVDPGQEGVFAATAVDLSPARSDAVATTTSTVDALVSRRDREWSRRPVHFATTTDLQEEASQRRPTPAAPAPGDLVRRRTSFGRFSGASVDVAELRTVLDGVRPGRAPAEDLTAPPLTLHVVALAVDGLAPGVHRYDPGTGALTPVAPGDHAAALQRNYFLQNYDLGKAAAVVFCAGDLDAAVRQDGTLGYRRANAAVGAATQRFYVAASSGGLAAGAALGFNNVALAELLRLPAGQFPLILWMLGRDRAPGAWYRFELFTGEDLRGWSR